MVTDDPLEGLSAERISELAGVSLVTARRWKRTRQVPEPARRLLKLMRDGELGRISRPWRGWFLDGTGHLVGPDGLTFKPGEVLALPFMHGQIAAYQARQRYAVQADFIEQRYVEPEELVAELA